MTTEEYAHLPANDGIEGNWGRRLVIKVLYPFALIAAPAFLLVLQVFFVTTAFMDDGLPAGVRSLAAVLLPLMVLTFLIQQRRADSTDTRSRRGRAGQSGNPIVRWWRGHKEGTQRTMAFTLSMVAGAAVMSTLQLSTSIPIGAIVASGAFSVLVGSLVRLDKENYIAYFFGFILGVLAFITILGSNF